MGAWCVAYKRFPKGIIVVCLLDEVIILLSRKISKISFSIQREGIKRSIPPVTIITKEKNYVSFSKPFIGIRVCHCPIY